MRYTSGMPLIQRTSLAVPLAEYIAAFYPDGLRKEIEAATPALALHATRLGTEVLLAEEMKSEAEACVVHEVDVLVY